MSKRCLFFLLALSFITNAMAQQMAGPSMEVQNFQLNQLLSRRLQPLEREDVEGTPFLTQEYKYATVTTRSGFKAEKVPVKFNIYHNEMMFKQNDQELALDSISTIVYLEDESDSNSARVFKAGYPAIGNLSEGSIYQLLGGGNKYHFLKYQYKKLEPKQTLGFYHLKEYINYTDYYIYSPSTGMVKVKVNGNVIAKAIPAMEAEIARIKTSKKLNLSKDADVAVLFNELDKLPTP